MLLNKKQLKAFALGCAANRAHKFTRVSQEFVDRAEFALREWVRKDIERLPSVGKTIK